MGGTTPLGVLEGALRDPEFAHVTPEVLGPYVWSAMHHIARGFQPTPAKRAAFHRWLVDLAVLLPCDVCSRDFGKIAPTVTTSSTADALRWTIDAHNKVNVKLGKPALSYADAIANMKKEIRHVGPKLGGLATKPTAARPTQNDSWQVPKGAGIAALVVLGLLLLSTVALAVYASRKCKSTGPPMKG